VISPAALAGLTPTAAAAGDSNQFSFLNLAILIAVVAVAYPLLRRLRRRASRARRRRWERDGLLPPDGDADRRQ